VKIVWGFLSQITPNSLRLDWDEMTSATLAAGTAQLFNLIQTLISHKNEIFTEAPWRLS
jgi:hypothetical protein